MLEKKKLSTMEKDKKNKLEKLRNDRELLALKEEELLGDIKGIESKVEELSKI